MIGSSGPFWAGAWAQWTGGGYVEFGLEQPQKQKSTFLSNPQNNYFFKIFFDQD